MPFAINADVLAFHKTIIASEGQLRFVSLAVRRGNGAVDIGEAHNALEIGDYGRFLASSGKEKVNH